MSRSYNHLLRISLVSLLTFSLLSGCARLPKLDSVLPDKRTEYKKSKSLPDLEVPPDLTTDAIQDRMAIPSAGGDSSTFSTYQDRAAERQREIEVAKAQTDAIRLIENEHVLAVEGAPVQIWPKLEEFWDDRGYSLELDDEELGIIETGWYENQEELIRDRFKIFAEPGNEAGTTVLYISHRGEELVPSGDTLAWEPRVRDVDLERRLVEVLQEHLTGRPAAPAVPAIADAGSESTTAFEASPLGPMENARAELISAGEGKVYLTVQEDFPSTWEITAVALDRVGVSIDEADKSRGVYYIRFAVDPKQDDEKGVWSKLKFWDRKGNEIHQLSLTGVGDTTEVVVLDKDGKWETSDEAGQFLSRLHDEINSGQI